MIKSTTSTNSLLDFSIPATSLNITLSLLCFQKCGVSRSEVTGEEEGGGGGERDKTRQRQDKTRQDTTRQDKPRQDKTRQSMARQDKTRQDKTRQDKTRQETRQDKRQDKRQDRTGQETRQDKRQDRGGYTIEARTPPGRFGGSRSRAYKTHLFGATFHLLAHTILGSRVCQVRHDPSEIRV